MKYLLAIMLGLLSLTTYADQAIYVDTLEDAIAMSEDTNKDVLLIFGAEWCGACGKLKTDLLNNPQMSDNLIICYVNIDKNQNLATEYRVRTIPHYILIRNKIEIKKEKGYINPERFIRWRNK